jgi:HEAT repeat protein
VSLAGDAEPVVRQAVAEALGDLKGGTPEAVLPLAGLLRDPAPAVRTQAARSLATIGPAAAQAVPDLVKLLDDSDMTVATAAARALGQVGGARFDTAIEALADVLRKSRDYVLREEAAHALSDAGHSPAALRALTDALADASPPVRREVLHALGRMPAAHAEHVLPALKFALADSDESVRAAAVQAAGHFGAAALPILVQALQNPAWLVRWWAAVQLSNLGPAGASALRELERLRQDAQPAVREAAENAIAHITGASPSPRPSPSPLPSPSPFAKPSASPSPSAQR